MTRSTNQEGPIWRHIADSLRSRIACGEVAVGGRLPTEIELCATFQVSRTSAMKALNTLASEGLIRRDRGRGRGSTVIALEDRAAKKHYVPIVLPHTGHFFDPLAHHLAQRLTAIHLYPILFTADNLTDEKGWQRLIGLGASATIFHGTHNLTPGMDRHWREMPFPVLIGRWPERTYRASIVHMDRKIGLLSAARRAITRGCAALVYFNHVAALSDPEETVFAEELRALAAKDNVAFHYHPLWTDVESPSSIIDKATAMLKSSGPKTVVLCGADFYAREVIAGANALGWKVGSNIGVVGCNNTPWAEALNIDSISLQETEIADAVVRLIQNGLIDAISVPSLVIERNSIPFW